MYYIPPKSNRTFNYEKIIVKESLEDCYKELFSDIATAWPHLDKSKEVPTISDELEAMLTFPPKFLSWETAQQKQDRFETFFKNAVELDFTNRVKIYSPYN